MKSIGLDLMPYVERGLLHFQTVRPSNLGLEAHLASMHQTIKRVNPQVVAVDPLTNFITVSDERGVKSMLTRLIDFLKTKQITTLCTHLSTARGGVKSTEESVSSIMDTWLQLRDLEHEGCRSFVIYVLKSRGMAHSHEMREFNLTDKGVRLGEIYTRKPIAHLELASNGANPNSDATELGGGHGDTRE